MASPSSSFDQVKKEYDTHAGSYNDYVNCPYGQMEEQLMGVALGNCTGGTVLDIGGGTGLRARQVIDLVAAAVDVVDISPEMLRIGEATEPSPKKGVRWFEADVSKPLDHLPLDETYDIVMANWVFDHAHSMAEYEGIWENVATRLRPGGRFISVRSDDPYVPCLASWEAPYGMTYHDHQEVPGGVLFRYTIHSEPKMSFEACSMHVNYNGSTEMFDKFGLVDVKKIPHTEAEVVKNDLEYWKLFLEKPGMWVVTARKRDE
ncbi:S-adenosyl-L-methionine-dependent methyltransferase [Xylariaceae sp. FL1019]|nr:S-adenosyl-L-methionine-dependent methyltransferase [Xylariaceae sp. FL1019]